MTLHDDTTNTEIKSEQEEKTEPAEQKAATATESRPIVLHNHPEKDNHTPTSLHAYACILFFRQYVEAGFSIVCNNPHLLSPIEKKQYD